MYAADGKVPVLNHPCEPKIFPEPIAIRVKYNIAAPTFMTSQTSHSVF